MISHRAVLDAVRDAVILADIETGMIVDASAAAERLSGRTVEELRTVHLAQIHPPEGADWARRDFQIDAQTPGLVEGVVLRKDGTRVDVEIATSHLTMEDGRRVLVGVFRDITERIADREKLRRSEQIYRAIGESIDYGVWVCAPDGRNT